MIDFQVENVEMPAIDVARVCKWLEAVAYDHDRRLGDVCYRFCSDEDILRYNRDFLGHDYFTDVITFSYSTPAVVSGDIVISLDTVRTNAQLFGFTYDRELLRVIVHGVLHLTGLDDKGPGEREIMEAEENKALALYDSMCK